MDGFAGAQHRRKLTLGVGVWRFVEPVDCRPADFADRLGDGGQPGREGFSGGNAVEADQADIPARDEMQLLERLQSAESARVGDREYGGELIRPFQPFLHRPAREQVARIFGAHMAVDQFGAQSGQLQRVAEPLNTRLRLGQQRFAEQQRDVAVAVGEQMGRREHAAAPVVGGDVVDRDVGEFAVEHHQRPGAEPGQSADRFQ